MRKIDKNAPIQSFVDFKNANPGSNWIDDFSNPKGSGYQAYIETRLTILLDEQDCLDGYTEIPIEDETYSHIDHFKKRSMFPTKTFDWDNLVAATKDNDFGANFKDNKSGITKADYNLFFNPVTDLVQDYFYYNERGEVEPNPDLDDESIKMKVLKTIEVFNLQNPILVNRRKTVIQQIKNCATLSPEEILGAMKNGGFLSVIEQYSRN